MLIRPWLVVRNATLKVNIGAQSQRFHEATTTGRTVPWAVVGHWFLELRFREGPRWVAGHRHHWEGERKPMNHFGHSDPAERSALMRLFYRKWRPTRLGRWVNRFSGWWSGLGLPPRFMAVLEVQGRKSGHSRSNPVVIATVDGSSYLVSMLGPGSDWVKNVEAAHGDAVIRQGRRRRVHLVAVPPEQRAPVLREYVRIASSGRQHFPLPVGAPLSDFEEIAGRYPVYRIDPS
jgi:deazaflavin-dependent oxidoreductase (nitroreductase family)